MAGFKNGTGNGAVLEADAPVTVAGAGIAGTWQALLLARTGFRVTLVDRGERDLKTATSYWAGGMLAPDCEGESAEPVVVRLGHRSLELWRKELPDLPFNGSLVLAHARDRTDFERFARLTSGHERVGPERLGELEPALAGRFREALFFPHEGHVEPRNVLPELHRRLVAAGTEIRFGEDADSRECDAALVDCRGLSARDVFPDLRGVKGETVLIETDEIALSRPVRLLHPRWPLYIVPRPGGRFLIGASTIESEDDRGASVRSVLELLTAAYAVHPAFGEARVVEIGVGLRPAFPDHAPRIRIEGQRIAVNGLYRHGFLLAPALAELTVNYLVSGQRDNEVMQWC